MTRQHISKVQDKSAGNLCSVQTELKDDYYHNNIFDAALALCCYKADIGGSLSHLIYQTQWSSGMTLWTESNGEGTATVKDGVVKTIGIMEPTYDGKFKINS
jgi:hypothetical protein